MATERTAWRGQRSFHSVARQRVGQLPDNQCVCSATGRLTGVLQVGDSGDSSSVVSPVDGCLRSV